MGKILDIIKEKINNWNIIPHRDATIEVRLDHDVKRFKDLEPDEDLNTEARDLLIEEVIKAIIKLDSNELEFKETLISVRPKNGTVAIQMMRSAENKGMFEDPVWFSGEKPYPLKLWLEEQILTNYDVVELEKGLIKLI